jgi:UDP-glucuronate 4-epimerase
VYETINLGESQVITLNEMLSGIEKELGKSCQQKNLPMQPGDVQKTNADIKKPKTSSIICQKPTTKMA